VGGVDAVVGGQQRRDLVGRLPLGLLEEGGQEGVLGCVLT
jgi:hypothetical protein